jgi:SPP1 gp7 family putative phage head morphogenesis protein
MPSLYDKKFYSKARSLLKSGKLSQLDFDVLPDICKAIDDAFFNGTTLATFRNQVEPILKDKGWLKKIEDMYIDAMYHLETIFRTNLGLSYASGHYKQQIESADTHPYWQYNALLDSRTRPAHSALNGKVFRYDDPFWDTMYPPNGYRCRCSVRTFTEKQVNDRGLKVESGTDNMVWEDNKAAGYKDPTTGDVIFTDPGWSWNPGKSDLSGHIIDHVLCYGVEPQFIPNRL